MYFLDLFPVRPFLPQHSVDQMIVEAHAKDAAQKFYTTTSVPSNCLSPQSWFPGGHFEGN